MSEQQSGMSLQQSTLQTATLFTQKFVAKSKIMQELVTRLEGIALLPRIPVLITGETGVGKEAVARQIHTLTAQSVRYRTGLFIKVNAAAIPDSMFEDQMFGHEAGSFTGAMGKYVGLVEQSHGGSLLLDEIVDVSLLNQVKLLNFLDDSKVRRMSSSREVAVDTRFIAATNGDLERAVEQKKFREDLFYRLAAIRVEIPPLRAHLEDIPLLVSVFLEKINAENHTSVETKVSADVIKHLSQYDWPGNVRQLYFAVARAVLNSDKRALTVDDFSSMSVDEKGGLGWDAPRIDEGLSLRDVKKRYIEGVLRKHRFNKKESAQVLKIRRATLYRKIEEFGISIPKPVAIERVRADPNQVKAAERGLIVATLKETKGSRKRAAEKLGLSYGCLCYKIKKFKITVEEVPNLGGWITKT